MGSFRLVAVAVSLMLLTGCQGEHTCPAWSFPAISARVTSASSGVPIPGALGQVIDGTYRDSLFDQLDGSYVAAYDRPGTYAVHIEREGFAPWDTSGIIVRSTGGQCATVETENIAIRLTAQP